MDALEYTRDQLADMSTDDLVSILNECESRAKFYYAQQMAKKILINALYGATGNRAFLLFNEKIAQAITGNGRFFIQRTANKIEAKLQEIEPSKKPYVVYGDTDSVYYQIASIMDKVIAKYPNKSIGDYVDIAAKFEERVVDAVIQESIEEFAEMLNASNPSSIGAKREVIADRVLFCAKKKYVARVRDLEGIRYPDNNPYMKTVGLELAKRATPNWCKRKLNDSLNIILDKSESELKTWIASIKPEFTSQPIADIAIHGNVSSIDYSLNDKRIPFMCRAALYYNIYIEKHNLVDKYAPIQAGNPVKLMHLAEPNPFGTSLIAYNSDAFESEFAEYIDYDAQYKKGFMDALNNMTKFLGYDIYSSGGSVDDW